MLQEARRHQLRQLSEGHEEDEERRLRKLLANPSADPDELADIWNFGAGLPEEAFQLLARNPNTPPEILVGLLSMHPDDVLRNPVFPLLLLEQPKLLQELPSSTVAALVKAPSFKRMLGRPVKTLTFRAAEQMLRGTTAQIPERIEEYQVGFFQAILRPGKSEWFANPGETAEWVGELFDTASITWEDVHDLSDQGQAQFRREVVQRVLWAK